MLRERADDDPSPEPFASDTENVLANVDRAGAYADAHGASGALGGALLDSDGHGPEARHADDSTGSGALRERADDDGSSEPLVNDRGNLLPNLDRAGGDPDAEDGGPAVGGGVPDTRLEP